MTPPFGYRRRKYPNRWRLLPGGVVEMELTKGYSTLIDLVDLPRVQTKLWQVAFSGGTPMASSGNSNCPDGQVLLHRFVMQAPDGMQVDHRNGDRLDNRRKANLRLATNAQNVRNTGVRRGNKSGFKGVSERTGEPGRWVAQISHNGRKYSLGIHETPEDAARAYDAAARRFHGAFARVNYPEAGEMAVSDFAVSRRLQ